MSGSDFDITTDSVGIGIGGERDIINEQFSVSGRMIYLPFFDIEGSGWDTELRIAYDYNEYLQFFFGGKWVNIDVDTATSINFAAVPGFSDSPTVFKKYKADLGGYVLGGSFNF